jgi:sugar lactone lactonase YvrE
MYLADWGNNRIRRLTYNPDSGTFTEIITVAGSGADREEMEPPCNVLALDVGLKGPYGLDMDPLAKSLICTTELGARLYRIQIDDDPGQFRIEQISGGDRIGVSGDGDDISNAGFTAPASVRFDPAGNLYVNDVRNHRLRRFTLPPPCEQDR